MSKQTSSPQIITVKQTPLYDADFERILDVPKNVITQAMNETRHEGAAYLWIEYREYVGMVKKDYTDPYKNTNKDDVVYLADIQTDDKYDPEQFVVWQNTAGTDIRCVNQCGEICCSAIVDKPLSEVLATWRDSGKNGYDYAFNGSKDSGTGTGQLAEILSLYGIETKTVDDVFGGIDTAYRYAEILEENQIIFGVSINQVTGELSTAKEINHWVLLNKITVNGTNGIVSFYNPFNNTCEEASWNFLQLSARWFFGGLVVPRQQQKPRSFIDWIRGA